MADEDEEESLYIDPNELASDDKIENLKEGQLNPMEMLQMYANRKAQSIVKGNKNIANAILAAGASPPPAPNRDASIKIKQETSWWEDLLREEASAVNDDNKSDKSGASSSSASGEGGSGGGNEEDEEHVYADLFSTGTETGRDGKLNEQPWWAPWANKEDCVQLLRGRVAGSFYIRQSESRQGDFLLMVNAASNGIYKALIITDSSQNVYRLSKPASQVAGTSIKKNFPSIMELVEYFSKHPLLKSKNIVLLPDAPLSSWFQPDADRKETEKNLKNAEEGEFVVRRSASKPNHFSLHFSSGLGKKPLNLLIQPVANQGYRINSKSTHEVHSTLTDLVYYHTSRPIGKCTFTLKAGDWAKGFQQQEGDDSESDEEDNVAEIAAAKRKAAKESSALLEASYQMAESDVKWGEGDPPI